MISSSFRMVGAKGPSQPKAPIIQDPTTLPVWAEGTNLITIGIDAGRYFICLGLLKLYNYQGCWRGQDPRGRGQDLEAEVTKFWPRGQASRPNIPYNYVCRTSMTAIIVASTWPIFYNRSTVKNRTTVHSMPYHISGIGLCGIGLDGPIIKQTNLHTPHWTITRP